MLRAWYRLAETDCKTPPSGLVIYGRGRNSLEMSGLLNPSRSLTSPYFIRSNIMTTVQAELKAQLAPGRNETNQDID